MCHSFLMVISLHIITIKLGQPISGTNPDISIGILHDGFHLLIRQAIRGIEMSKAEVQGPC